MRSPFETPPERPFYRFLLTFGFHLGTLWNHFFDMFFDLESNSKKELNMNLSWQWNGKRVESCSSDAYTYSNLSIRAVLCCVVLCCAVLSCFAQLCCVLLCSALLCCVLLCSAVLCSYSALLTSAQLCFAVLCSVLCSTWLCSAVLC